MLVGLHRQAAAAVEFLRAGCSCGPIVEQFNIGHQALRKHGIAVLFTNGVKKSKHFLQTADCLMHIEEDQAELGAFIGQRQQQRARPASIITA